MPGYLDEPAVQGSAGSGGSGFRTRLRAPVTINRLTSRGPRGSRQSPRPPAFPFPAGAEPSCRAGLAEHDRDRLTQYANRSGNAPLLRIDTNNMEIAAMAAPRTPDVESVGVETFQRPSFGRRRMSLRRAGKDDEVPTTLWLPGGLSPLRDRPAE